SGVGKAWGPNTDCRGRAFAPSGRAFFLVTSSLHEQRRSNWAAGPAPQSTFITSTNRAGGAKQDPLNHSPHPTLSRRERGTTARRRSSFDGLGTDGKTSNLHLRPQLNHPIRRQIEILHHAAGVARHRGE